MDKERLRACLLGYLGWNECLHLFDWPQEYEKVRKTICQDRGKRGACQIKPQNDNSWPQADDSGRKTTPLRSGELRRGRQVIKARGTMVLFMKFNCVQQAGLG